MDYELLSNLLQKDHMFNLMYDLFEIHLNTNKANQYLIILNILSSKSNSYL